MKRLILGLCLAAVACSGKSGGGNTAPTGISGYAATRWVPANATYVVTAKTVRDAQQGLRDVIETFGLAAEVTVSDVGRELEELLLVNPLSAEALANIGIDVDGGFAMFSEAMNPTLVVHLKSRADFQAFMDRQTKLRKQSVMVDGTEIITATLGGSERISWAIADDWLWLHLGVVTDDGESWFKTSRKTGGAWSVDLSWVKGGAKPNVVGSVDVAKFLADAAAKIPEVAQCSQNLSLGSRGIGNLALAVASDKQKTDVQLALDVGDATAAGITSSIMPTPEGWAASTAQVPLAVQWNLDIAAMRARFEPCLRVFDLDLREIDEVGVRAARAFIRTFDPDERKGTGAIALDLSHKDFFAAQLDQIPMRSALERKRTFGPHSGKALSIPMFLTVDYVLTDQLALAGVGDGLLAVLVGKGGTAKGPIAELALQPLGLSQESWVELLRLVGASTSEAKTVAAQLHGWREARVNLTIEGNRLMLAANGVRR